MVTVLATIAVFVLQSMEPPAGLDRHAEAAPGHGVLYAIINRDGTGERGRVSSTLVAVRLDGTQEAAWNGGSIVLHDLAQRRYLPLIRRGERIVQNESSTSRGYLPLAISELTKPLAWPFIIAAVTGDGVDIESMRTDDEAGVLSLVWSQTIKEYGRREVTLSQENPGQIIAIKLGERVPALPVVIPDGMPVWMGHLPLDKDESIQVFYDPEDLDLNAEWLLKKEQEHRLKLPSSHLRYDFSRPLWDDPRVAKAAEPRSVSADPEHARRGGRVRNPPPPTERFDDAWRPTEGDAQGPLARQQSGFRRALLFTLGGTLVLVGVGIVVARKLRA